jgi:hypothetical protein
MVLSVHQAADIYEGRATTGPFTLLAAAAAAAAARQGKAFVTRGDPLLWSHKMNNKILAP